MRHALVDAFHAEETQRYDLQLFQVGAEAKRMETSFAAVFLQVGGKHIGNTGFIQPLGPSKGFFGAQAYIYDCGIE